VNSETEPGCRDALVFWIIFFIKKLCGAGKIFSRKFFTEKIKKIRVIFFSKKF